MRLIAILLLSSPALAGPVSPDAHITLVRSLHYDGDVCDQTVFEGTLRSLLPKKAVITSVQATLASQLRIQLYQSGLATKFLNIHGEQATLQALEKTMAQPNKVRLTEFAACAKKDPSLTLVDLVAFGPNMPVLKPSVAATFEIVRKNPQGKCAPMFSKSLGGIVHLRFPKANLSLLTPQVRVFPHSRDRKTGRLVSKRLLITFPGKNSGNLLSISVAMPNDLVYSFLHELSRPNGKVQVTGIKECRGKRWDDPYWITDFSIQ